MCWYPPVLANAVVPPQRRYLAGSIVSYFCINGYRFNILPNTNILRHTITCKPDGIWTLFPAGLSCQKSIFYFYSLII